MHMIACADQEAAYVVDVGAERMVNRQRLDESYRESISGPAPERLADACVESGGIKPAKFLKPLVEQYGELIFAFRMYLPKGGPFSFADVATGQVDVLLAVNQPYVDVFSGVEVARKAGLTVSDLEGNPFHLNTADSETTHDVLVSRTDKLHELALDKLALCKAT